MAGHTVYLPIDQNPIETLNGFGGGSAEKGFVYLNKLVKAAGPKRVGNTMIMGGSVTVAGASTTAEITFEPHQPFKLNGIVYTNSATDTGKLAGMKINGKPIEISYGYTLLSGSDKKATFVQLAGLCVQGMDFLEIYGAGAKITIQFEAVVAADVIDVFLVGWDIDFDIN